MISPSTILRSALILLATGLLLSACNQGAIPDDDPHYFEFITTGDERFVAETSDQEVISRARSELALDEEDRTLHINGDIERGNNGYNHNWSWHFVPDEWDLVEVSVEVCDGRPSWVDENVDYFVDDVGYFCPWSSRVYQELDPADVNG